MWIGVGVASIQVAWALLIVVASAATDGVPADEYSSPNRAAFSLLLVGLSVALPTTAAALYGIAVAVRARLAVAIAVAHVPAVVATLLVLTRW